MDDRSTGNFPGISFRCLRSWRQLICERLKDFGPAGGVSGAGLFGQALMRDDDFGCLAVGAEFDRHQRIVLPGVRRIPGEDEAARRLDGLVDARVAASQNTVRVPEQRRE